MRYHAYEVTASPDGSYRGQVIEKDSSQLPSGEVLIRVAYSSLNYKDALSASGNRAVTRNYPHVPGIDAAGEVLESSHPDARVGSAVIVTGYDLGMNTPGGFGGCIRVPASWVVPCPPDLSLREAMLLGTAGLTAALCLEKLLDAGVAPDQGPILVTGATGGVGVIAVQLLARLGFEVLAATAKMDRAEWLRTLGAADVIERSTLTAEAERPLLKELYAGAVDVAGGATLGAILKSLRRGGSVAACGLVAAADFPASVLPFILRGVNLLGVDSVEISRDHKSRIWTRLAGDWRPPQLAASGKEIRLEELGAGLAELLAGQAVGRYLLNLRQLRGDA